MRNALSAGDPQEDLVNPDFKTSNHIMKQYSLVLSLTVKGTVKRQPRDSMGLDLPKLFSTLDPLTQWS